MTDSDTVDDVLDGWTLPDDWTQAARDRFARSFAQRPELAGADLGGPEQAAALTSAAERLDAIVLAAGMVSTGSTGQTVVHPPSSRPASRERPQRRSSAARALPD